jgi:DNA-binding response OmpR family regulator
MTAERPIERGRVLVIEDEPRIASFVGKQLRSDGWDVMVAEDGEVGLFLAQTESFHVVLLDLELPGRSGLEVLREIRAADGRVPLIVLTGHDEPAVRRSCLESGATEFVTKPLELSRLQESLRRLRPIP